MTVVSLNAVAFTGGGIFYSQRLQVVGFWQGCSLFYSVHSVVDHFAEIVIAGYHLGHHGCKINSLAVAFGDSVEDQQVEILDGFRGNGYLQVVPKPDGSP